MSERQSFIEADVAEALARAVRDNRVFRTYGPILEVFIEAGSSEIRVPHGLDAIPDGVDVAWSTAPFYSTPHRWDRTYAYISLTAAGRVRLSFYTDRRTRPDARRHTS